MVARLGETDRVTSPIEQLHAAARRGDRAATARLLSVIERGGPDARLLDELVAGQAVAGRTGERVRTVGVTGAPGSGKSTLTSALIGHLRGAGGRVAVLAIDPTSPYTGGAILGDRIRMQDHALDDGVLIRSMATRGQLGGLAVAVPQAVRLLDNLGWPLVIVETVGVGQVEVDIAGQADTTVVVVNPGWGDAVQASKAGLIEIADIVVVNKADRPGAKQTCHELTEMIGFGNRHVGGWQPPVLTAVAIERTGIEELATAIDAHRDAIDASGELSRRWRERRVAEWRTVLADRLHDEARRLVGAPRWADLRASVEDGTLSPAVAADHVLAAAVLEHESSHSR